MAEVEKEAEKLICQCKFEEAKELLDSLKDWKRDCINIARKCCVPVSYAAEHYDALSNKLSLAEREELYEIDCTDFEKMVVGWEPILSRFHLGKRRVLVIEYDPEERMIHLSFCAEDEDGGLSEETWGHIYRPDCERFMMFAGQKYLKSFEIGKRQRIIVDYEPQNKKASILIQHDPKTRSSGSPGTNL